MKKWGSENELYCKKLYDAIMRNLELVYDDGIYAGKEGCLRLAREYAYGLLDYHDEKQIREDIQASYGVLCVRVYNLRPPVDAWEWVREIKKAMGKERLI